MTNRLPLIIVLSFAAGCCTPALAQTYNFYFGDIHSHTWYSDGNQDQTPSTYTLPVARGMTYAKSSGNMNFLGISDHNHTDGGFPMTLALWRSGMREADSLNQDGTFACMYGQEWGVISGGGHVLIYGTDKLFGWNTGVYDVFVTKSNYPMLWDSVRAYGGFCYLAHPQSTDYGNIFSSPYNAMWDSVVRGCALRNGPATSTVTNETATNTTVYDARYHDLLRLGYHVAPCANQDNHMTTFGRVNQQRTVVLATSLTRANVVDALRNRRAYATEDHNLQLDFEVGTHQMGEIFTQGSPIPLRVKVTDPDGSNLVATIQIRYGIPGSGAAPTTLTSVSNQDSLVFSQPQAAGSTYYYYAYVQETNGRRAWSAPMWITVPTGPIPQAFTLSLPANASPTEAIAGTLRWQSSVNATQYDVYLGTTNPPTTLVSSGQPDTTYNYAGLLNNTQYWWKVAARNVNGTTDASGAPWTFTTIVAAPSAFSQSLPANSALRQPVDGTLSWQASANAAHYDVYLDTNAVPVTLVSAGQSGTTYDYAGLSNSKDYFWKVVAQNAVGSLDATGAPWTFRTIGPSPGTFALELPPNSAASQPLAGLLRWNASAHAAAYDVYLDVVNPPAVRVDSNRTDTSYSYAGLLPGHAYYWKIAAKNENAETIASDAPHSFSTVNVPDAATNAAASDVTTATMRLTWTDNAADETGYRIYRSSSVAGPFAQMGSDLPTDASAYSDSGLAANTSYYYRIVPFNGIGEGNALAYHASTLALLPGAPSLNGASYAAVTVIIRPSANPPETEFAVQAKEESNPAGFMQAGGTLGTDPVWRTYAEWGGAGGSTLTGLHSCHAYTFSVLARNLDNVPTAAGADAGVTLPCFNVAFNTLAGWNLLSLPLNVPDPTRAVVFPGSVSNAFFYQGSYVKKDSLRSGAGFWLKYGGVAAVGISGEPRTVDSIPVVSGWNLIGTLSQPVSAASVVSDPPSIVTSNYFGYNGVYFAAESLLTMKGYWVKASGTGKLLLSTAAQVPSAAQKLADRGDDGARISVTFENAAGQRQTVSLAPPAHTNNRFESPELPPVPPAGTFDVRFEGRGSIMTIDEHPSGSVREFPLEFHSDGGSVQVGLKCTGMGEVIVKLNVDGISYPLEEKGTLRLKQPAEKVVLVLSQGAAARKPVSTALLQNYPNPFNPATTIRFELATESRVTLKVYDMLGREVAKLFENEFMGQGVREAAFDASGLSSGVYIYRLVATSQAATGSGNGGEPVTLTRQMVVLK